MFVRVPNAPIHRPHSGEQIQIMPGTVGFTDRRRAMDNPTKDTIIAYRAVIFSPRIPNTSFPIIPASAKMLIAVAAVVEFTPSFT